MKSESVIIIIILLTLACGKDQQDVLSLDKLTLVPSHFPEIPFPDDNQLTMDRWRLGQKLFFDPVMSVDSSISCATCHVQNLAFADNNIFTDGVYDRPGTRNVPSLANVAYQPYYTREGGVQTLEAQVLVPIQEHNEFNANIVDLSLKLSSDTTYQSMSWAAYDRPIDPFVITRSIATFERTIVSANSLFDKVEMGEAVLDKNQIEGEKLFFSERLGCTNCHGRFNFTDYSFANNGLYEEYPDPGRYRLTRKEEDRALFKVPSLRNVQVTAPYMHDGSLLDLESVILHYESGGANHKNKDTRLKAFTLTAQERSQLITFLYALTDYDLLRNSKFNIK